MKLNIILQNYTPEPNTGCWLWLGYEGGAGYGQCRFNGIQQYAHRIFYQVFKGNIPKDKEIDHICTVRCCVNPDHMQVVYSRKNKQLAATRTWRERNCGGLNKGQRKYNHLREEVTRLSKEGKTFVEIESLTGVPKTSAYRLAKEGQ